MIESLENRRLCSATVHLHGGLLHIDGTPGNDAIAVIQQTDYIGANADVPRLTTEVYVFDIVTGVPEVYSFQPDADNHGNHVRGIVASLGDGNDVYDGSMVFSSQLIDGGDGDDVIAGGRAADVLSGGDGNDTLLGGMGNDLLLGGDGDDLIEGHEGWDLIFGGRGNDTVFR